MEGRRAAPSSRDLCVISGDAQSPERKRVREVSTEFSRGVVVQSSGKSWLDGRWGGREKGN